ncbi:MAG TPA: copper amine oxidase N-terminal domain-containing protein, partial [Candidatus Acidoferrales bacterium]|nr:copper amine oxidase N-terminal domain-containing protein [Candidatus Acidoferrales bacterium]
MKPTSTGVLAAIFAAGFGLTAASAQSAGIASHGNVGHIAIAAPKTVAQAAPPADFGSPPSGEVPILFNDHHVYTKPDELKRNRVLAALVRGNTILVPLRSMFEQMGATVSYDPASKTADVSKPGSDVKVTVGKAEVIINGESRPLDVPPEIYKGVVVVPVRVISEG